jgi:hypothetical protein
MIHKTKEKYNMKYVIARKYDFRKLKTMNSRSQEKSDLILYFIYTTFIAAMLSDLEIR